MDLKILHNTIKRKAWSYIGYSTCFQDIHNFELVTFKIIFLCCKKCA